MKHVHRVTRTGMKAAESDSSNVITLVIAILSSVAAIIAAVVPFTESKESR